MPTVYNSVLGATHHDKTPRSCHHSWWDKKGLESNVSHRAKRGRNGKAYVAAGYGNNKQSKTQVLCGVTWYRGCMTGGHPLAGPENLTVITSPFSVRIYKVWVAFGVRCWIGTPQPKCNLLARFYGYGGLYGILINRQGKKKKPENTRVPVSPIFYIM